MINELYHHGILGQRWGIRNGDSYPLSPGQHSAREQRLMDRKDKKFINQNDKKLRKALTKVSKDEMKSFERNELRDVKKYTSRGKISNTYINAYNRKMADVWNKKLGDLYTPSGKVIRFVAKRGELGLYTALASANYDINQVKNGVFASGKVAYNKKNIDMMETGR